MKRIFSSVLFVFFIFQSYAVLTIKGKVVDSSSQEPIDFVNIALIKPDSQLPAVGVTTDKQGNFLLPQVQKGKYTLRLSFVGYNTLSIPLYVSDKELDMGIIKLFGNNNTLTEVEVVGQGSQMTFDIDKKVFTVDKNIAAAGGSASDVLQNIPSVDVDGEGNVSLRNNSSVEVWINGKPSGLTAENRAQVLQQMPAESIDKVEVMTNPSAKFNPEGTSGIINIVLKKNRKAGYFGSVSGGIMYVDGAKVTGTIGANVNYSSSKLDAYLNLGYRSMDFVGKGTSDRYGLNGADTVSLLHQTSTMQRGYGGIFGRAGIDYHLNEKHTLSLSGFGMLGTGYSQTNINNTFTNNLNPSKNREYSRDNTGDGTRPSISFSLDYKYDIDKLGSNLSSSLSYSPHKRTGSERIKQIENGTLIQDFTQTFEGNNTELEFKLDYTHKFSENKRLELGWNSSSEIRESPASAFDNIKNKDIKSYFNKFNQTEYVHAGYATYGSKYGKLNYQAGLRAEYFKQSWDNTFYQNGTDMTPKTDFGSSDNKLQLFPSAYLSYSLPQKNELQLNITRRIRRPHGREINPFRQYSDSTNITYGNPGLLPELSMAYEFNYIKTWDNHTLSSSLYYRYTDNVMQNVQYFNNNTMENTTMNVSKMTNAGVEIVAKNRLLKIMNLTSTLNLYYNKLDSGSYTSIYNPAIVTKTPEQELFSWNIRTIANIMLSKTTIAQFTGDYSSPRLLPQGKESSSWAIDLGLRQTFFNKNLNLNLIVRDVFNSRQRTTITYGDGFYQNSKMLMMGRMIGLTATYNFGNMKPKQGQNKKPNNDMNMDTNME